MEGTWIYLPRRKWEGADDSAAGGAAASDNTHGKQQQTQQQQKKQTQRGTEQSAEEQKQASSSALSPEAERGSESSGKRVSTPQTAERGQQAAVLGGEQVPRKALEFEGKGKRALEDEREGLAAPPKKACTA